LPFTRPFQLTRPATPASQEGSPAVVDGEIKIIVCDVSASGIRFSSDVYFGCKSILLIETLIGGKSVAAKIEVQWTIADETKPNVFAYIHGASFLNACPDPRIFVNSINPVLDEIEAQNCDPVQ
jgi:hypothetical protein